MNCPMDLTRFLVSRRVKKQSNGPNSIFNFQAHEKLSAGLDSLFYFQAREKTVQWT